MVAAVSSWVAASFNSRSEISDTMGRSRFSTLVADSSASLRAIRFSICPPVSGCRENSTGNSSASRKARFSAESRPMRVKFWRSRSLYSPASPMPSNEGEDRRRIFSRRSMYPARFSSLELVISATCFFCIGNDWEIF